VRRTTICGYALAGSIVQHAAHNGGQQPIRCPVRIRSNRCIAGGYNVSQRTDVLRRRGVRFNSNGHHI
jgi:hypothetical protein